MLTMFLATPSVTVARVSVLRTLPVSFPSSKLFLAGYGSGALWFLARHEWSQTSCVKAGG